jgi:putative ABC transport system ATP-binding protein
MIVKIENIEMVYETWSEKTEILNIPQFAVDKGKQVAIFGPSGSGKSTFLHIMSGLLLPTSGSVEVCGEFVHRLSEAQRDHFRSKHIGYIFQTFNLLQGYTALENVLMGMTFSPGKADRAAAKKLLEEVGLGGKMKRSPYQLSFGEQQRVSVARAIANKPELILADEPTGSLDPHNSVEIIRMLKEMCREYGCSLVIVSHNMDMISYFEHTVDFKKLNRALGPKEVLA